MQNPPEETNCPPNGDSYLFRFPIEISPLSLAYHVGDTIAISARIYNPFYDYSTGDYYNLNNFPFIFQLHVFNNQYSSFDINEAFDFNGSPIFEPSIVNSATYGRYLELDNVIFANNFYSFDFKVVLKKAGLYKFEPSVLVMYGDIPGKYYFDGKCYNNGISFSTDIMGISSTSYSFTVN